MYYLTITARRKDAKRHISKRSSSLDELRRLSENLNHRYIIEIYDGKWNLIETISE